MRIGPILIFLILFGGIASYLVLSRPTGTQLPVTTDPGNGDEPSFARETNLGKAYLENRESEPAVKAFDKASKAGPDSALAWRNLARAKLLAQEPAQALESLLKADSLESNSASTNYLLGLTYSRLSDFENARISMEKSVQVDPSNATARSQLSNIHDALGQSEAAEKQLAEVVKLDPLHASAHYKLRTFARKRGDVESFEDHHREFMRLKEIFGDEGRSAEALEACLYTQPEPVRAPSPAAKTQSPEVKFVEVQDVLPELPSGSSIAVLEVDLEGSYILFIAGDPDSTGLLTFRDERFVFEPVTVSGGELVAATACLPGDFHDDVPAGENYDPKVHRLQDVLLLSEASVQLLKRTGKTTFEDATTTAGLGGVKARAARWADYDHDGDLDLALGSDAGLSLYQNNGDGTFEDVSEIAEIPRLGTVTQIVAADMDTNVAIDFIVVDSAQAVQLDNQRVGTFTADTSTRGPAGAIAVEDLDRDGNPDIAMVNRGGVALFSGGTKTSLMENAAIRPSMVRVLDVDNDGWPDLLVGGEAHPHLLRANAGSWSDMTQESGFERITGATYVASADFDLDGDTDVIAGGESGLRFFRNEGGNRNRQLRIDFVPIKSNASALGVEVEVREQEFWASRLVQEPFVEVGIGSRKKVDTLQTMWTNGVVDNRVDVGESDNPIRIVEKNVATGSCPFVYAWDGTGFRFVTDILGNSPVGLSLRRGVELPADPDEFVEIGPSSLFPPRDGMYVVDVTEEFREVLYLDHARVVAIDHDPAWEIHTTDKLMPAPFPASELWALSDVRPAIRVDSDDGLELADALAAIDSVYAEPGRRLPSPYRGQCDPRSIVVTFDDVDASATNVLALTGWLQYGDASTNIALSQSSDVQVIPPTLELRAPDGDWRVLDVVTGMPAGKTKTILVDLSGQLPESTAEIRLTTTFEIYWDRLALGRRVQLSQDATTALEPASATLRYRGFSDLRARMPLGPTTPAYDDVSEYPPWRTTLEGWCTRFGDVTQLVAERDDALVVMNAGDALEIKFDAGVLPQLDEGLARTFFFYSVGWDKDGDHNVVGGDRVAPLPVRGEPIEEMTEEALRDDWQIQFNTRWVDQYMFDPARGSSRRISSDR